MFAAVALALVSCNEVSNITSIYINESVTCVAGDTVILDLSCEPSTEVLTPAEVTWASSDATVATVDAEGTLIALAPGTATITATFGELSSACALTVVADERELLIWSDVFLNTVVAYASKDMFAIKNADGSVDSAFLCVGKWYAYTDGLGFDAENALVGEGYMLEFYAPVFYDGSSYWGSRHGFEFVTDNPATHYTLETNKDDIKYYAYPQGLTSFETYAGLVDSLFILGALPLVNDEQTDYSDAYYAYKATMPYGSIEYYDGTYLYLVEGILGGAGHFNPANAYGTNDVTNYDFTVNWFAGYYGLKVLEDGSDIVRPWEFAGAFPVHYVSGAASSPAPACAPRADMKKVKVVNPIKAMPVR